MYTPVLSVSARVLVAVFSVCATLCTPQAASAGKRKHSGPPVATVQRFTTLRASPPSILVSGRGGVREVRYLSVVVSNIGSVEAEGVHVVVPGGSAFTFPLRGPKKLSPGSRATYVLTSRIPAGVSLQPHAIATCSTCRR